MSNDMCGLCGKNPIEKMVALTLASVKYEPEAPMADMGQGARFYVGVCVKGGCFLKLKESFWRMRTRYMRAYVKSHRQEVPE